MRSLKWPGVVFAALAFNILSTSLSQAQEPAETPSIKGIINLEADALYYDALTARIKGDLAEAERMLEQVVKLKPDAAGAYYDLARISLPNKPDKASEYIKKAIALDGENKWYKAQHAEILAFRNQYSDAAEIYDQLAGKEKYNEDYLLKSSLLHQRSGDYKKSLSVIDKLIETTNNDEEMMLQKYQLYLKMNNVEGAAGVVR